MFDLPADLSLASACISSMSQRSSEDPPAVLTPAPGAVCLDGSISEDTLKSLQAALETLEPGAPLVVIMRSGGGDASASIRIARELLRYETTTIAHQVCISSCANYLLPSGRRSVVLPDTILGFHGGLSWRQLSPARDSAMLASESDFRAEKQLSRIFSEQERLFERIGIRFELMFDMENYNHLSDEAQEAACPGGGMFIVMSPQNLESYGYRIDAYHGPKSADELAGTLARRGLPTDMACYSEDLTPEALNGTPAASGL